MSNPDSAKLSVPVGLASSAYLVTPTEILIWSKIRLNQKRKNTILWTILFSRWKWSNYYDRYFLNIHLLVIPRNYYAFNLVLFPLHFDMLSFVSMAILCYVLILMVLFGQGYGYCDSIKNSSRKSKTFSYFILWRIIF